MTEPIICFGQQPCGFFPKRFLAAKIRTARELQNKIGGKIIFFYHDSDADYRETITILRDRQTNAEVRLNFTQENKIQKKYSPLYIKRVPAGWKQEILKQLPRFMDPTLIDLFASTEEKTVADFCLKMYEKMGLLDGMEIIKSSSPLFREQALELHGNYFADVNYQGEIVRSQLINGKLQLHEGGGKYFEIPKPEKIEKFQKSAGRDQRFLWMNSIINCSHYIFGEGEKNYLNPADFPSITFVDRQKISQPEQAWLNEN